MDRFLRGIIAVGAVVLALGPNLARAQETLPIPSPSPKIESPPKPGDPPRRLKDRPDRPGKREGEFDDARRIFDKLPPEQREKFRENFRRWEKMPPEEREELRGEDRRRRDRIAREIDETIQSAGLQLSPDQRQVFALRYAQERRRIEEALRKEMEAKRKPMLEEMMQRLAKEFANAAAKPSASPTAAP